MFGYFNLRSELGQIVFKAHAATVNSLLSPPGGLIDFKHSEGGLIREGGLIYFFKYEKIQSSTI